MVTVSCSGGLKQQGKVGRGVARGELAIQLERWLPCQQLCEPGEDGLWCLCTSVSEREGGKRRGGVYQCVCTSRICRRYY